MRACPSRRRGPQGSAERHRAEARPQGRPARPGDRRVRPVRLAGDHDRGPLRPSRRGRVPGQCPVPGPERAAPARVHQLRVLGSAALRGACGGRRARRPGTPFASARAPLEPRHAPALAGSRGRVDALPDSLLAPDALGRRRRALARRALGPRRGDPARPHRAVVVRPAARPRFGARARCGLGDDRPGDLARPSGPGARDRRVRARLSRRPAGGRPLPSRDDDGLPLGARRLGRDPGGAPRLAAAARDRLGDPVRARPAHASERGRRARLRARNRALGRPPPGALLRARDARGRCRGRGPVARLRRVRLGQPAAGEPRASGGDAPGRRAAVVLHLDLPAALARRAPLPRGVREPAPAAAPRRSLERLVRRVPPGRLGAPAGTRPDHRLEPERPRARRRRARDRRARRLRRADARSVSCDGSRRGRPGSPTPSSRC